MIQYITMLFTYEHNQILFHIMHIMTVLNAKNELYHDSKQKP